MWLAPLLLTRENKKVLGFDQPVILSSSASVETVKDGITIVGCYLKEVLFASELVVQNITKKPLP